MPRRDRGFTLTELLIVITILGVLAGIVIFAIMDMNQHSRKVACQTDVHEVQDAVTSYIAQKHHNPPDLTDSLIPYLDHVPSLDGYGLSLDSTGRVTTTEGSVC